MEIARSPSPASTRWTTGSKVAREGPVLNTTMSPSMPPRNNKKVPLYRKIPAGEKEHTENIPIGITGKKGNEVASSPSAAARSTQTDNVLSPQAKWRRIEQAGSVISKAPMDYVVVSKDFPVNNYDFAADSIFYIECEELSTC